MTSLDDDHYYHRHWLPLPPPLPLPPMPPRLLLHTHQPNPHNAHHEYSDSHSCDSSNTSPSTRNGESNAKTNLQPGPLPPQFSHPLPSCLPQDARGLEASDSESLRVSCSGLGGLALRLWIAGDILGLKWLPCLGLWGLSAGGSRVSGVGTRKPFAVKRVRGHGS